MFILHFSSDRNAFYLYRVTSTASSSTPCCAHAWREEGCGYCVDLSVPCNKAPNRSEYIQCLCLNYLRDWVEVSVKCRSTQKTSVNIGLFRKLPFQRHSKICILWLSVLIIIFSQMVYYTSEGNSCLWLLIYNNLQYDL